MHGVRESYWGWWGVWGRWGWTCAVRGVGCDCRCGASRKTFRWGWARLRVPPLVPSCSLQVISIQQLKAALLSHAKNFTRKTTAGAVKCVTFWLTWFDEQRERFEWGSHESEVLATTVVQHSKQIRNHSTLTHDRRVHNCQKTITFQILWRHIRRMLLSHRLSPLLAYCLMTGTIDWSMRGEEQYCLSSPNVTGSALVNRALTPNFRSN